MKKNIFIALFVLFGVVSLPFISFGASNMPAPSDNQVKSELLDLKKKQSKTKANLKINKLQAKTTLTKVKKQRTLKKKMK